MMKCGAQTALGIGAGYLLGRTKKMRLALMLGALGASGRLGGAPGEVLQEGTKALAGSPELTKIVDDVRGKLLEAGKAAALAAVNHQIDALTDRLHERAEVLRAGESVESVTSSVTGRKSGKKSGKDEDTGSEDEYDEGPEDDESEADEAEDDEVADEESAADSESDADEDEGEGDEDEGDEDEDEEDQQPRRRRTVVARRSPRRRTQDTGDGDEDRRTARPRSSRRTTERSGSTARRARR